MRERSGQSSVSRGDQTKFEHKLSVGQHSVSEVNAEIPFSSAPIDGDDFRCLYWMSMEWSSVVIRVLRTVSTESMAYLPETN
jgi:hypothetical protein